MAWRETLFVWSGAVDSAWKWDGKWIGRTDGEEDVVDERNTCGGSKLDDSGEGIRGKWRMWYVLDRKRHVDKKPLLLVENSSGLLVGTSSNEYGEFVVAGQFSAADRILSLSRRYIDDSDPRARMSVDQLVKFSCEEIIAVTFDRNVRPKASNEHEEEDE